LGVAPAASFCLAAGLACLALGQGTLPAALVEDGQASRPRRIAVSFHDEHSAAAALLAAATPEDEV
jgi:hypothetical protein